MCLVFGVGFKLKDCGDDITGGEKSPALQFAGAEIFYEAPELCFKVLAASDAAFKIKFFVCHVVSL